MDYSTLILFNAIVLTIGIAMFVVMMLHIRNYNKIKKLKNNTKIENQSESDNI